MSTSKPERPSFSIDVADNQEMREACFDVRVEVFVVEQGFSVDDEIDQYEPISSSLLLSISQPSPPPESTASLDPSSTTSPSSPVSKKPIGTIRFTPSVGKVSRLAVLKQYRQYGFGKELMLAVEKHAVAHRPEDLEGCITSKEDGKKVIRLYCHSQIYVMPFYERLGFRKEGEEFDEDGAPHQKMIKDVEVNA